jgi:hypothetical protein
MDCTDGRTVRVKQQDRLTIRLLYHQTDVGLFRYQRIHTVDLTLFI